MKKILLLINRYAHYLSSIILAGLMFLTVTDILGRAIFNNPVTGKYELTGLCLIIIVYYSFGYAEQNKDHVVIDFFYELLPPGAQKVIYVISQIICLATISLMVWRVFEYGVHMMSTGAITASLKIPYWPVILIAFIGLVSFLFSIIINLFFPINGRGEQANDIS